MEEQVITYKEFIIRYPQFGIIPKEVVDYALEDADLLWDPQALRKWWKRICYLFTAHVLALQYNLDVELQDANPATENINLSNMTGLPTWQQSSPGHLAERRDVTELAKSKNAWEAWMAQTKFGLELMALLNLLVPGMKVVIEREPRFTPYAFLGPFNMGW